MQILGTSNLAKAVENVAESIKSEAAIENSLFTFVDVSESINTESEIVPVDNANNILDLVPMDNEIINGTNLNIVSKTLIRYFMS